jgi:hypothetical protein
MFNDVTPHALPQSVTNVCKVSITTTIIVIVIISSIIISTTSLTQSHSLPSP